MAYKSFILLALHVAVKVTALAFLGPKATECRQENESGRTQAPGPTTFPRPQGILKRQDVVFASTFLAGSDQTCGYLSGSPNSWWYCIGFSACNLWPAATTQNNYGGLACCDPIKARNCLPQVACINSEESMSGSCDTSCKRSFQTVKCFNPKLPYCHTLIFEDVKVMAWFCDSESSKTAYYNTTYLGQTAGGRFTPLNAFDFAFTTSITITASISSPIESTHGSSGSSTSSGSFSTTGDSTANTSSSPTPTASTTSTLTPSPRSNLSTGAIVGISIAGLAFLALLVLAIFMLRRLKRDNTHVSGIVDHHPNKAFPQEIDSHPIVPSAEIDGTIVSPLSAHDLRNLPERRLLGVL